MHHNQKEPWTIFFLLERLERRSWRKTKIQIQSCDRKKSIWLYLWTVVTHENRAKKSCGPRGSACQRTYHVWLRQGLSPGSEPRVWASPIMLSEICLAAVPLNSCSLLKGSISSAVAIISEESRFSLSTYTLSVVVAGFRVSTHDSETLWLKTPFWSITF